MTTQELAPATYVAPTSYSEIIRDEVKAECGRRGISQRRLALGMGLSQPSISERWRGRISWTLDEVERLERVLGLDRGALLFRCARRDSNPQPSDLWPLEVLLAASAGGCFECRELGCSGSGFMACDCPCHEDVEQFDDLVAVFAASADVDTQELDDEDEYRRGQCGVCSGDCEPGYCIMFDDLVGVSPAAAARCEDWCAREGCTENYQVPCECPCHGDNNLVATTAAAVWELAA